MQTKLPKLPPPLTLLFCFFFKKKTAAQQVRIMTIRESEDVRKEKTNRKISPERRHNYSNGMGMYVLNGKIRG